MTRVELARDIYKVSYLTGTFKLRSGAISNEYFDKYRFESKPILLREIARQLIPLLPDDFDLLAGLEMGGIPLAVAISFETGKPAVFVRKKAKEYGTCRISEGAEIEGKKLLVVEDVITSGGQVVLSSQELRAFGAEIKNAVCVIDRESGGSKALSENGIELKPLFTMSEIKALVSK
ncbi:MAG: orotate phosphoribosyltransferase [Bacteroidota bacterium]|nr:orotate phosphoribosyltransferase [Bacteroidota bacterium]